MRRVNKSKAAYTLVDLSEVPAEYLQDILEDAATGGGEYGVRVVEESINGGASHPIYGVYDHDVAKWEQAKEEMGAGTLTLTEEEAEKREEALRSQAEAAAAVAAAKLDETEAAEVAEVTGDDPDTVNKPTNKNARR
jgi:hypothetical protein